MSSDSRRVRAPRAGRLSTASLLGAAALAGCLSRGGAPAADGGAAPASAPRLDAPVLPPTPYAYAAYAQAAVERLTAGGPRPFAFAGRSLDNTPPDNPITDAGATLGRVLFYDRRLSANDRTACASCHLQALGFSDSARFSRGFAGAQTRRHSMALANARFYRNGRFFWDERAGTLEAQVLQPVQDSIEMGMTLPALEAKLAATPYYAPLFEAAFGTPEITSGRAARALAQFVRALVTADSRFDREGAPGGALTAEEREGLQVFAGRAGCASCHTLNTLATGGVHNTGLDAVTADSGAGRGRFKVPSLRNVAVRPPYMHDGRFATLEAVVEHYDSGVRANPDLDRRLVGRDGAPRPLGLTPAQKGALVAFLRALTDSAFLHDPRFADPFAAPRR